MKKGAIEIIVGVFILAGIACMAYTSVQLGKVDFFSNNYYPLTASFTSISGLKVDTYVQIAGVPVGKVKAIKLMDNYQAVITLDIQNGVKIQEDAIASVKTNGLLGEKYIEIIPGGSEVILKPGEAIFDTEPPFDLTTAIKNFAVSGPETSKTTGTDNE